LSGGLEKQAIIAKELSGDGTGPGFALLLAASQLLSYWCACLLSLRRFGSELRTQFSSIERRTFGWLKWMLAVNLCMWLLWIVSLSLDRPWAIWLDRLAIPGGFYLLAYLGLRQPTVFGGRTAFVPTAPRPAGGNEAAGIDQLVGNRSQAETLPAMRYARSGLPRKRLPELRERLETLMQMDKPWLENDLTLNDLSERLGVSTHHLSQLLNEEIGMTFFDFINSRRIREVQRCLADPAYGGQTILAIALASGFNSKAAFNTVFKQQTGTTPSRFRQHRRAN
jgi:AraC-like DNA-binding protein